MRSCGYVLYILTEAPFAYRFKMANKLIQQQAGRNIVKVWSALATGSL